MICGFKLFKPSL